MQGGSVDELLDVASNVRVSTSERSKSAAPWKIGSAPVWPEMTGKSVTCMKSTRPAAISDRFNDKLPCERKRHLGLLLEAGDQVGGVAAHDGRIRPLDGFLQRGRHHGGRMFTGSLTADSSSLGPSASTNCRKVLDPSTIRCSSPAG